MAASEVSQCNARVRDFPNSVLVWLLFSKMLEIKEVERQYGHGGFAIKQNNEQCKLAVGQSAVFRGNCL